MIRELTPVRCSTCDTRHAALYESTDWPGLVLCRGCLQCVAVYLLKHELADCNPLAEALLSEDSNGDSYRVWHPTLAGPGSSFSHTLILRVKQEF